MNDYYADLGVSRDASLEIRSNTSSNFGCAVNGNLAAMIADPADLVRGLAAAGSSVPRRLDELAAEFERFLAGGGDDKPGGKSGDEPPHEPPAPPLPPAT